MKTTVQTPVRLNDNGRPLVFSFFGGSHGYCGEYLRADGRVAFIKRDGDSIRDARDTDRLCMADGSLIPLTPAGARLMLDGEVPQPGDFHRWSDAPRETWVKIGPDAAREPYYSLPVATLRERCGQPALRFATLRS